MVSDEGLNAAPEQLGTKACVYETSPPCYETRKHVYAASWSNHRHIYTHAHNLWGCFIRQLYNTKAIYPRNPMKLTFLMQALQDLNKFMDSVHNHMNNIQAKTRQVSESEDGRLPPPKAELFVPEFAMFRWALLHTS